MSNFRQNPPLPVIPEQLESPLVGFAAEYPHDFRVPRHSHAVAQLIHAASGVMTVSTRSGSWVVPPHRAVWVPAGTEHRIRMTGRVAMRTLYLDPAWAAPPSEDCGVVQVSPLLREAILRVMEFPPRYATDGHEARIAAVILDELRLARIAPLHLPRPRDPRARRVADALAADPGDRRDLAAWAQVAGASERTLERLFERETALGFGAWRQQARLLRSLEALAAGEPVTRVALEVGYETPSAFVAMFRRALGTTPGRYFESDDTRLASGSPRRKRARLARKSSA